MKCSWIEWHMIKILMLKGIINKTRKTNQITGGWIETDLALYTIIKRQQ